MAKTRLKASGPGPPLLDEFFDAAPIGLAILHLDDPADPGSFRVVRVNRMAHAVSTVPPDAIGKRLDEIPIIKDSDLASLFIKVLRDNTPTGMGEGPGVLDPSRHYAGNVFPIPPDAVGLVYYEITAQRRNERQLARAQELAKMGSWSWQVGSDRVQWSDEMYRIYGLTPETFKGTLDGFLERVHPDDRAMVQSSVGYALEHGTPFHHQERIIRPSGDVRILDSIGECILGSDGKPVQLMGLCRDITEDARAVQQLEESEQRFRKIFEASPAAICLFELDNGKLVDVNPRFVELLGYGSSATLVGKPLDLLGMWTEPGELARLADTLRRQRSVREMTLTYRTFGGQVRRAVVALELIEIEGQQRALALFWRA